ncbi:MAG TPA: OmpA family protein [Kofleriaceae bacterium]|nr:OmpA family protein [Kofleriaceae bacterium]
MMISIAALVACGSPLPPKELVDAREAYLKAQSGPAQKFVPAELHVAGESLAVAEKAFTDDAKSQDAIDDAYIALRKIQRAVALGEAAEAEDAKTRADREAGRTQREMLSSEEQKLRATQGELAKERESVEKAREETAAEHAARLAAEKKAQDAMDALAKTLAVRKEDRGTVITLSGGVLFATGKADILPGAQTQLNQVAEALKTQAEHHFTVTGHTDNQGTDAINDDLSTRRANAVRDYLVVHGVSADAITAQGMGSHQPVADNHTAEGRAMNRRVEIVVDPDKR